MTLQLPSRVPSRHPSSMPVFRWIMKQNMNFVDTCGVGAFTHNSRVGRSWLDSMGRRGCGVLWSSPGRSFPPSLSFSSPPTSRPPHRPALNLPGRRTPQRQPYDHPLLPTPPRSAAITRSNAPSPDVIIQTSIQTRTNHMHGSVLVLDNCPAMACPCLPPASPAPRLPTPIPDKRQYWFPSGHQPA